MRQLILVVHTSLDGFVAGPKGELDGFDAGEENLAFVCKITETADTALFGRISYEMLNRYWPTAGQLPDATAGQRAYSNWYNNARKIVLSATMTEGAINDPGIIRQDIANEIKKIKNQEGKDILLFGSPAVAQTLMQAGLIDSCWIFINPVIFGQGIPLFTGMVTKSTLTLSSTKQFANGELALHYIVNSTKDKPSSATHT